MKVCTGFAALATGLLSAAAVPASAVSTLTFAFVVLCDDTAGTSSSEFGFDFPTGSYLVTVTGGCLYGATTNYSVSTPCAGPAGPMPCATVNNVPAVCRLHLGSVSTGDCGTTAQFNCSGGSPYYVELDGRCVPDGVAVHYHATPGPMTAKFVDCGWCYADNVGAYIVTATWTPL